MGFKWKDAFSGAINGFEMGAKTGNPYAAVGGAVVGGAAGGYAKDIDKGVTGDSKSGTVEGALDVGGKSTGGVSGSSFGNLFSMFDKNSDSQGNLNAGKIGEYQGMDLYHSGSGSFSLGQNNNLNMSQLLQIAQTAQSFYGNGG